MSKSGTRIVVVGAGMAWQATHHYLGILVMSSSAGSADVAAMVIVPGFPEIDPTTTGVAKIHTFST